MAESDGRRGRKRNEGGPVNKPAEQDGRKRCRAAAHATETVVHIVSPLLQGEEAVAQDGRERCRTAASPIATAMAAVMVFPLPKDNEEVAPVDGGADEHGGGGGGDKSWRLRVKETLWAFSSNYLHYVQEEQQRAEAARQELEVARALSVRFWENMGKSSL